MHRWRLHRLFSDYSLLTFFWSFLCHSCFLDHLFYLYYSIFCYFPETPSLFVIPLIFCQFAVFVTPCSCDNSIQTSTNKKSSMPLLFCVSALFVSGDAFAGLVHWPTRVKSRNGQDLSPWHADRIVEKTTNAAWWWGRIPSDLNPWIFTMMGYVSSLEDKQYGICV